MDITFPFVCLLVCFVVVVVVMVVVVMVVPFTSGAATIISLTSLLELCGIFVSNTPLAVQPSFYPKTDMRSLTYATVLIHAAHMKVKTGIDESAHKRMRKSLTLPLPRVEPKPWGTTQRVRSTGHELLSHNNMS